tara:strand:+ start:194 stop:577 length:384 start_codon:yes stop_codon:yes gene_type:complete
MFDWKKPTVQMLGRWQPWHGGHQELFKRAYAITGQVLIMVRDVKGIGDNPFDFDEISKRIISELKKDHFTYRKEYDIMHVPNIINISYGRDVGYTFTEHDLGKDIHQISATNIRKQMRIEGKLANKY